ncbi:MAG: hypothetical protein J6Q31_07475 [Alistipes sp.]|nr:hypothetical protein [Alistipes sp.]
MKQIEFKGLSPDQIEVRPTDTREKGKCTLLLYMHSRSAGDILDNAVGAFNWKIEYKEVNKTTFGILSIYDEEKGVWVSKEDTGSESNIEASKGLASDILKRCLARWGWNHLYTAPRIKIDCPDKYYLNVNGQEKMTMTFKVAHIAYQDKQIVELTIVDRFDNVVFDWCLNRQAKSQTIHPRVNTQISERSDCRIYPKEMSNEEKLISFRDSILGTVDNETLEAFFNFYMRNDCMRANGKTIVANWNGIFDPQQRWKFWLRDNGRKRQIPK